MTAARTIIILSVAVFAAVAISECARRTYAPDEMSEMASLAAARDAALHALDTIKARHAEREIRDQKHADSLRRLIARAYKATRDTDLIIRADTVFVPVEQYLFIRDTVLPACEACASRLDSSVTANRIERTAANAALQTSNAWGESGWRTAASESRKAKRWKRALPVVFVGGALLGAYIRGP